MPLWVQYHFHKIFMLFRFKHFLRCPALLTQGINRTLSYTMLWVLPWLGMPAVAQSQVTGSPPNIVLIYVDDMGNGDLGITGAQGYQTPHINKLAQEGALLTQYYSPQAVCSASRLGLLTGCYPNRLGMSGALDHKATTGINPAETTLPELLLPLGYATAAFGKWHLGHLPPFLPLQHGFQQFFGIPYSNDMWPHHPVNKNYYPPLPLYEGNQVVATNPPQQQFTRQFTQRTLQFIEAHKAQPFFVYLAHPMPHVPLFVSDSFSGKSGQGLFADVMMELDWSVGQIMQKLDELGIAQNTLVIFTSDNGPWLTYGNHAGSTGGLREGKGTTFEGGQRVPCIFRWKDRIAPGTICNGLAAGMDILPTIAGITGAALPALPIDGLNLWPMLSGQSQQSPRQTLLYYYRKNNLQAIRHGQYKLVFAHNGRSDAGIEPGRDGLPGRTPENAPIAAGLYDLRRDPGEQFNLLPFYPHIAQQLDSLARQARLQLGDDLQQMPCTNCRPPGRVQYRKLPHTGQLILPVLLIRKKLITRLSTLAQYLLQYRQGAQVPKLSHMMLVKLLVGIQQAAALVLV